MQYKNKKPVIPFKESEIVASCKYVDMVVPQENMDKLEAYKRYKFNVMFVGDDWFATEKWMNMKKLYPHIRLELYITHTRKAHHLH